MSKEKENTIKALGKLAESWLLEYNGLNRMCTGAEIIRTPTEAAHDSDESNIGLAKKLLKEIPNSVMLDQYNNPASTLYHPEF